MNFASMDTLKPLTVWQTRPWPGIGTGSQIQIPELSKGIYVTGVTKRFTKGQMVRVSCEGKLYDNISTTTTTTTTTTA